MASGLLYYNRDEDAQAKAKPAEMSYDDIAALAAATARAQRAGLIPDEVAERVLPMAMLERHEGNFGVKELAEGLAFGYPPSPKRDKMFEALGFKLGKDIVAVPGKGYKLTEKPDGEDYAGLMMAMVSDLTRRFGPKKAIEFYNGNGKAIEKVWRDGKLHHVPANSDVYVSRVEEARGLLHSHPQNAALKATFDKMRQAQLYRQTLQQIAPPGEPAFPERPSSLFFAPTE